MSSLVRNRFGHFGTPSINIMVKEQQPTLVMIFLSQTETECTREDYIRNNMQKHGSNSKENRSYQPKPTASQHCLLWPVMYRHQSHGFQNVSARERFPHPYKEYFVPLSNQCGIS